MKEEEVYLGSKAWLIRTGYMILAGQPAKGNDNLPVIEVKNSTGNKGSRESYKPDLIAYNNDCFYIIECKPKYDKDDNDKLNSILDNEVRINSLYNELIQYRLIEKSGYKGDYSGFRANLKGVLAYYGSPKSSCSLIQLIVNSIDGEANWVEPKLP